MSARRAALGAGLGGCVALGWTGRMVPMLLGAALGCAFGAVAAHRAATQRALERSRAMRLELPDALDLLAAVVDGGAAPAAALARVGERLPGVLGAALVEATADQGDGVGERIAAIDPSLRPLAALLRQSEDLGVPVASALRLLASDARARMRSDLRERAAMAAPRMLLVVGALLAPASLLVVIGGQALALREAIG